MIFYLGTHQPHWLRLAGFPLFVSHRRLRSYRVLPQAKTHWALDSGGFSELSLYGKWVTTPEEYLDAIGRYEEGIGLMDWAAPQDWMCEPHMIEKTGLSVAEHQYRTVENYLLLCEEVPVIPVLQGWDLEDYLRCIDLYRSAGVDLFVEPVVGVGSVCRRQNTAVAELIFDELADAGLRLHGFGVKITGLARFGHRLVSSDSMSWSVHGRRDPALPGHTHKNCANCFEYASQWRSRMLGEAA